MAFPENVDKLLTEVDVHGACGCLPVNDVYNMMLVPHAIELTDSSLMSVCQQYSVEGLGYDHFGDVQHFGAIDKVLHEQVRISWEVNQALPIMGRAFWFLQVREALSLDLHTFQFDAASLLIPLPVERTHENQIHHLELFSGGYGGWKMATKFLQTQTNVVYRTIAVEADLRTAINYALTHTNVNCCILVKP